jgi:Fe2+ transport system protein B
MFQAVFSWSVVPADALQAATLSVGNWVGNALADSWLRSLIVDGIFAGVGAVIVFLPQILILFLFILVLESTGYMVRAAFIMDRLMSHAGLSGRAFIPLLSSFACAVPGIMATRTIDDEKDRLTTILVAPLMTCSARLPVYTLIIGAFIPAITVGPGIGLQGLILFGLYISGIASALLASLVLSRTVVKGGDGHFMMELPKYQLPRLADVAIGLWQRAMIFLKRAGTIILATTIILWALASFPQAGPGEKQSDVSIAGHIADGIHAVCRADRFQQGHQHGPAARNGGAGGGGGSHRHRLLARLHQRSRRPNLATAADRPLEPGHGAGLPRLVRVRAAMHLDHRRHAPRDQWLALAAVHGQLPVRARLCGGRRHILDGCRVRPWLIITRVLTLIPS